MSYRSRTCTSPKPAFGGANCKGANFDTKIFKLPPCRECWFLVVLVFVTNGRCGIYHFLSKSGWLKGTKIIHVVVFFCILCLFQTSKLCLFYYHRSLPTNHPPTKQPSAVAGLLGRSGPTAAPLAASTEPPLDTDSATAPNPSTEATSAREKPPRPRIATPLHAVRLSQPACLNHIYQSSMHISLKEYLIVPHHTPLFTYIIYIT